MSFRFFIVLLIIIPRILIFIVAILVFMLDPICLHWICSLPPGGKMSHGSSLGFFTFGDDLRCLRCAPLPLFSFSDKPTPHGRSPVCVSGLGAVSARVDGDAASVCDISPPNTPPNRDCSVASGIEPRPSFVSKAKLQHGAQRSSVPTKARATGTIPMRLCQIR